MKKTHKALALILALLMALSLAACGAASKSSPEAGAADYADNGKDYPQGTAVPHDESAEYSYADSEEAPAPNALINSAQGQAPSISPEKIIYSGNAELETTEFDVTVKKLGEIIEQNGGFIQSSNVTGIDYYSASYYKSVSRSAWYEIRIPSEKFSAVTGLLETLGNVPYSSTYAENISAQYQDTTARLTALRAQEERYLELLGKANTVEEVLYVEQYLSEVRYEIERLETQIRSWDSLVSYSTLSLTVSEVVEYTEQPDIPVKVNYGEQLSKAFSGTIDALGIFFKGLFKFLVGASPVIVLLAVIAVPTVLLVRRHDKKKKAAAAPRPEDRKE
jgi:hypothetical protein